MYLVVSIEINTCKKHFVFSGLEDDPVEFGFVVVKAFGVEFGVEHSQQTGFCFTQLQRKDTFITETAPPVVLSAAEVWFCPRSWKA